MAGAQFKQNIRELVKPTAAVGRGQLATQTHWSPSFPRKRESRHSLLLGISFLIEEWMPAFASMTQEEPDPLPAVKGRMAEV